MVVTRKATHNPEYIKKYESLLAKLNISFKSIEGYILSFIHRSVVNERPDFAPQHNERLEFLGDAVLELVVTDKLFHDFPEKSEGELTDIRSAIVRGRNLAIIANNLEFNKYLILGNGERQGGGENNNYILANTLEAFIGALYRDLGYVEARDFILKYIYSSLGQILEEKLHKDAKSLIQEYIQSEYDITPTYNVLGEEGPDHDKSFTVGVYMGEKKLGEGGGTSKKKAEEQAAINAYNSITTT